jgi:hypothetical protein
VSGDRHHDGVATGEVSADDRRPDRCAGVGEAARQAGHPGDGQVAGHDERDHERRRDGPHRRDVREVLHGCACPDVVPRRPAAAEVSVLDQHVGRHDEPAVGRRDDGGVVAGAQQGRGAVGQEREDPCEQLGLGQVTDELGARAGQVGGVGHDDDPMRSHGRVVPRPAGTVGPCLAVPSSAVPRPP